MGILGFAASLAASAVSSVVETTKANNRLAQLRTELEQHNSKVEEYNNESISIGKQTVYNTKLTLYKEGLASCSDKLLNVLTKMTPEKMEICVGSMHEEICDLTPIFDWVENTCEELFLCQKRNATDKNYDEAFGNSLSSLVNKIKEKISAKLRNSEYSSDGGRELDFYDILYMLSALKHLTNDDGYMPAINALNEYVYNANFTFTTLHEVEYGNFQIKFDEFVDIEPEAIESMICRKTNNLLNNATGYFEGITENLNSMLLMSLGINLWNYADKTPFDKAKFYNAVNMLNSFKCVYAGDNALECVLAEIYMKNKLGGEDLVRQNIDEIVEKAQIDNPAYARAFCSFLAWLGAYNVEYEVLKKAVSSKIQLTPEMQDRLNFLAKGGTSSKLKIYDVTQTDMFLFDSSTVGWTLEEYEALLTKFRVDRKTLQYSLLINKWEKALPLAKHKKFAPEALEKEFICMIDDFDGEITYEKADAVAVDMNDMLYEDNALFRFCSKRNRGLSVIFKCEKFGRNLNLSILTLFTPSEKIPQDDILSCIKSILVNSYVNSFRESILQAIDDSILEKVELYEEDYEFSSSEMD